MRALATRAAKAAVTAGDYGLAAACLRALSAVREQDRCEQDCGETAAATAGETEESEAAFVDLFANLCVNYYGSRGAREFAGEFVGELRRYALGGERGGAGGGGLGEACGRRTAGIAGGLRGSHGGSHGGDLAVAVTGYKLLSLAAESGPLGAAAEAAEGEVLEASVLEAIAENVERVCGGDRPVEERERIEDGVALAREAVPVAVRMGVEERNVSFTKAEWETHPRPSTGLTASGLTASHGRLNPVKKCLRFLALLDFAEAAASRKGVAPGTRSSLGCYAEATGTVPAMMEFLCECIAAIEPEEGGGGGGGGKKKKDEKGKGEGDPEWMDVFGEFNPNREFNPNSEGKGGEDAGESEGDCAYAEELDPTTVRFIGNLCSYTFYRTLQTLPSVTKNWYNDDCKDKAVKAAALDFVEDSAGRLLLKRELEIIEAVPKDVMGEMNVSGNLAGGRIVATYLQDETELRVVVTVPAAFPLKNVTVDCSEAGGGGGPAVGKKWGLMMNCLIKNQDGGIADALLMWKKNIDHEFQGVEPCPICYCVLEPKTRSMPTLNCKTCISTHFHNGCLVKWFQQSGKNVCVVCQQDWKGGFRR